MDTPQGLPAQVPATSSPHPRPPIVDTYNARLFAIREVRDYTQRLIGGILTIMDAAVTDPKQSKALRTLLMAEAWERHYSVALAWAEKEGVIEQKEGILVQEWREIDSHRAMHPGGLVFNPFPFSTTLLTAVSNE